MVKKNIMVFAMLFICFLGGSACSKEDGYKEKFREISGVSEFEICTLESALEMVTAGELDSDYVVIQSEVTSIECEDITPGNLYSFMVYSYLYPDKQLLNISSEEYEAVIDEINNNTKNVKLYFVYTDDSEWPLMMVVKDDCKTYELEEKKEYNILLKYVGGHFFIESTYEI